MSRGPREGEHPIVALHGAGGVVLRTSAVPWSSHIPHSWRHFGGPTVARVTKQQFNAVYCRRCRVVPVPTSSMLYDDI
jgi:hypothetical protein